MPLPLTPQPRRGGSRRDLSPQERGGFRRVALGLGLALMLAAGLGCGGQPDPFARRLPKPTPTPAPWQRGFQPDPSLRQSSNALPALAAGLSAAEVRHGR